MWHPDDGVLHALLDGELTGDSRLEVEAHLRSCIECDARFREAKHFAAEADSLVNAIEVPPARAPASIRPPGRRRIPLTTLAWAATLVLAAGLGYWGQDAIRRAAPTELREGDRTAAGPESVAAPAPAPMSTTETDARALATDRVTSGEDKERAAEGAGRTEEAAGAEAMERQVADRARVADPTPQARPATPGAPAAPVVGGVAAAAEGAREDEAASPGWRTVTMEQAVQVLGGAMRLVDGMTPERFDVGPGTLVPGGDPTREVVRVVYAGGAIVLDQQRSRDAAALRRAARYEDAAVKNLAAQSAAQEIEWRSSDGFRYVVTGTVGADSLKALADRVR